MASSRNRSSKISNRREQIETNEIYGIPVLADHKIGILNYIVILTEDLKRNVGDECTLEASQLHMAIVRNVTNAEEIFGKIKSGELKCGLVKATLLLDPFQLVVAANKASLARASGKMTTKSVYTETLYNLSPSRNISQSLSGFGADGKVGGHLVAFAIGELSELEGALMEIRGDRIAIEDLQDVADVELIRKTYGVKPGESAICPLLDSIVTRIGAKKLRRQLSIA